MRDSLASIQVRFCHQITCEKSFGFQSSLAFSAVVLYYCPHFIYSDTGDEINEGNEAQG